MNIRLAVRIARRELRGGLAGFRVFLACLALGVAAIAGVGLVRAAISGGLAEQGAVLLGGDAELQFTYRHATDAELAFMNLHASAVSEAVTFRSMAVVGEGATVQRALTDVKGVDGLYPLTGAVTLAPAMPMAAALAAQDGVPGAVMDGVLSGRLGLKPGDTFKLGTQVFRLSAVLVTEPDSATGGFGFGPRTIVRTADLAGSGLLKPGTLFDTRYRLLLSPGESLAQLQQAAEATFKSSGMRWTDKRDAAPGISEFVRRIGSFLVLVGLAGLAVGGVGVSAAVRAYLERKTATIATLKTLGAEGGTIFLTYLLQIAALTLLGVALGVALGAAAVMLLAPVIAASLPFPVAFGIYPEPLVEAAIYGILTALIFTLWPLARTEQVRAAALYRDGGGARGLPRARYMAALGLLVVALIGGAAWFSGVAKLALWSAAGVLLALAVLVLAAMIVRRLARRLSRSRVLHGHTALRLALGAIGGPREEAASVVLSLGLGLAVLAAVGQIDGNLRAAIQTDLPERAPSYYFVDIQPDQLQGFLDRLQTDPGVSRVETAPMLRGIITKINGRPSTEVAGNHWVLKGDRGVTMSDTPPSNAKVTAGQWWPAGYDGPPQISFAAKEGAEMGLKLGDAMTVNILGRDITGTITSFRDVNFQTAGIGFILSIDPAALAGAPHTDIATVYCRPEAEAAILRDLANAYPNITAIRVRDAIAQVSQALSAIASATAWAAAATLLTGFIVLIGAAAAGERARLYEAAVLKTLGATRGTILASFALRAAILGGAAGLVAIGAGGLAGWAVMRFVMQVPYEFEALSALSIVAGGVAATLLAGLIFALRPLAARPAQILRAQD
jgi:putative ABC transport system permease protein